VGRQPVKLAFLVFAACTCACVKAPLEVPLPAPAPAPPPAPPDLLVGEVQGSLDGDALEESVGAAEVVAVVEALEVADALGVTDALGEAASGLLLPKVMPRSRPAEELEAVGEAEAEVDGDAEDVGNSPFVRSHTRDCSDGAPPDDDEEGDGEAVGEPEPESDATATAAGVNVTAIAAAKPSVSRFIADLQRRVRPVPSGSPTRAIRQKTLQQRH